MYATPDQLHWLARSKSALATSAEMVASLAAQDALHEGPADSAFDADEVAWTRRLPATPLADALAAIDIARLHLTEVDVDTGVARRLLTEARREVCVLMARDHMSIAAHYTRLAVEAQAETSS